MSTTPGSQNEGLSAPRSIAYNYAFSLLNVLSQIVFPLVVFPYVTRILLPDGIGRFSFAMSIITYLSTIGNFGVQLYGVVEGAKRRHEKRDLERLVSELFSVAILFSIVAYALLIGSMLLIPRFRDESGLLLVLGSSILFNALGFNWLFQALERYRYIAIRNMIIQAAATAAIFLLVRSQRDYVTYAALTIAATNASNLANFLVLRKDIRIFPSLDLGRVFSHVPPMGFYFLNIFVNTFYSEVIVILIGLTKSNSQISEYNVAIKVTNLALAAVGALGTVLLPRSSSLQNRVDQESYLSFLRKSAQVILFMAVPLSLGIFSLSGEIIELFAGRSFMGSVPLLRILAPMIVTNALSVIAGYQVILPKRRDLLPFLASAIGAVVNAAFMAIFLVPLGSLGGAISKIASEIAVAAFLVTCSTVIMRANYLRISSLRYVIVSMSFPFIHAFIAAHVHGLILTTVLTVALSSFVYGGALLLLRDQAAAYVVSAIGNRMKRSAALRLP